MSATLLVAFAGGALLLAGHLTIEEALPMYAWHCRHHVAPIVNTFDRR